AIEHVGHRRGLPRLIRLEHPQRLTGHRVSGHQRAAILTEYDKASGRGEGAAPRKGGATPRNVPDHRAGANVERSQDSLRRWVGSGALGSAEISLPAF